MRGKEKCKALKEIRKKIAEENDIYYAVEECTHKGDCKGTCPRCESELRYLERELEKKRRIGEKVAIAGISVGAMGLLAGCNPAVEAVVENVGTLIETVVTGKNGLTVEGATEYIEPEIMGDETFDPGYEYPEYPPEVIGGEPAISPEDDLLEGEIEYFPEDEDGCKSSDGDDIEELEGDVAMPVEDEE